MSRIEKFVIGKGVTSRPSEAEEWTRRYLELTVRLPEQTSEKDFYESLLRAERIIDDYLNRMVAPSLDVAEVQGLPWVSYKTKKTCMRPDESGWILSDPARHEGENRRVVEELCMAIERTPNKRLVLGDMEHSLSGKEGQFISRRRARAPN